METVTSRGNAIVEIFRTLARGRAPGERRILLDGIHLVEEARAAGLPILVAAIASKRLEPRENGFARLGDELEIRSRVEAESKYRAIFHQDVYRVGGDTLMIEGRVELVCVNQDQKLVPLPQSVIDSVTALLGSS